ncbi:GNAT family N-acetyltransferase [Aldersonia sp. NBC_00410]|uniref:GNAT family N-acetyltransferase n=1 Tax=Aldersonia sp. NBC_00410 TaxID=2975954 RepID=UPI0022594303|nr:GNAT family N-acetyltransferase [Aldersonia sp. NBC_00410]MCX5045699.1 GNAT family N-acetyltransferase [Aldersonia sp. NBC_00410]
MRPQTLTDATVWLDPPIPADIDVIAEVCRDPSIGEWTSMPVPYRRADAEEFVDGFVVSGWAGQSPTWAVRPAPAAPLVGMVGLIESAEFSAEIGFWLASSHRGRGLMSTAVQQVCAFALRPAGPGVAAPAGMGLQRVEWRAFVGNHDSAAVARRTGFRFEGTLRSGAVQRGTLRDCWIAGRLHSDPPGPVADWPSGI